ncbi:hypothetical protein BCL80_11521 [Streptomyces avidinii]|nr:hypothetical protein BCL80_11521 [Streptomyces avidinii]SNX80826.1 hypothetical protein SAMN05421860_11321 [Streptomyces microflavus]
MSAQPDHAPLTPYAPAPGAPAELLAQLRADRRSTQWVPAFEREWGAALEESRRMFSLGGLYAVIQDWQGRLASAPAVDVVGATVDGAEDVRVVVHRTGQRVVQVADRVGNGAGERHVRAEVTLAVDVLAQRQGELLLPEAGSADAVAGRQVRARPSPPQRQDLRAEEPAGQPQVAQAVAAVTPEVGIPNL